ncbi:MAG TPA: NAD(P)-dependent oxidoreductase [Steroidobacteraceae bacterium]|nr:NAD(P)-dependent oxidoreductase [Steroidobacteraceae bacterium]
MKVAFFGVGTMGRPMAANIIKGGHPTWVFDADADRSAQVARELGAGRLSSISDLGDVEVIVTMLPDARSVRAVALGENGIAAVAKPGTIVVDMSSSQPLITKETGAALAARGITLIDAPVSGGSERAIKGTLTIMIGGDDREAMRRVRPVLECMGTTFFEVGGLGSGHAAKALNNVVGATNYAILAETMMVAKKYGIDQQTLIDIVNTSTGQSFVSSVVMKQFVLPGGFNTGFKVGLISKDASIAAELSSQLSCDTPLIHLADQRWIEARDALGAGEDHSRAILAWQHQD